MSGVNWEYYDKEEFKKINEKYLPDMGEGETKATQLVTALNKLIYRWYNDGDVYDNTHYLSGWANDLSSYANWLAEYVEGAAGILDSIFSAKEDDYELILKKLADKYLNEELLAEYNKLEKVGSIYECEGNYEFVDWEDDSEDEYYYGEEY